MHPQLRTHLRILAGDQVRRVISVEVRDGPLTVGPSPCEEQPRALGRLRSVLGVLQVEPIETRSVMMIAADDLLPAVHVPDADAPIVTGHRLARVETVACRSGERDALGLRSLARVAGALLQLPPGGRRIGRHLRQVTQRIGGGGIRGRSRQAEAVTRSGAEELPL